VKIAGGEKVDKESFDVLCSLCKPFAIRYKTRGEKQVERLGKTMCLLLCCDPVTLQKAFRIRVPE
jgi:hypothetical protein